MVRALRSACCIAMILAGVAFAAPRSSAQTKAPAKKAASPPAKTTAVRTEPAAVECPAPLGAGVTTQRAFCDILAGRDATHGVIIKLPPHQGEATVRFALHNRHTYSEEQTRAGRAYAQYTATVFVATLKGEVLTRVGVQSTFRAESDLFDRIGGGAGATGLKAVAPVGMEEVRVTVPKEVTEVSLVGEKLTVERLGGRDVFTSAGRPVAIVSSPEVEYKPVPPKPARKPTTKRKR
jgi:hypothetical protein